MAQDEKILKIISNETLNSIDTISIVTPSIYKSFFDKHALDHNTDIPDEEKMTDHILDSKIQMCQSVQERNSTNINILSQTTDKALLAIKEKDEISLSEVLSQTKALKQEIEKLKEAVYKDELTNVYNRKWLHDNFLKDNTNQFNKDGVLVILDLNFFKLINDTYGHIIGDKVLIYIANQLKTSRENVIRYGGDEFILIFDGVKEDIAIAKIDKIRENIISKKLKAGENSFRVSFSIGAHAFKKNDSLDTTIALADKNMYNDKIKIKKRISGID